MRFPGEPCFRVAIGMAANTGHHALIMAKCRHQGADGYLSLTLGKEYTDVATRSRDNNTLAKFKMADAFARLKNHGYPY